jgi:hypothetical protein
MKLADSWLEDTPTDIASECFHDEVEEVDDLDEAKDGCGGVVWQPYVLKKPHTSYKMLLELAREIKGIEKKRGRKLRVTQYKRVFDKWEAASRRFLRPSYDYFTEFLAKLNCVTVPKGETLQGALERAKRRQPPVKVLLIRNEGLLLLASLCRELQEMAGDQPIMLHQMSIAKLFGYSHHRNISNWIKALKTLDVLKPVEPWSRGKAARYFYVA